MIFQITTNLRIRKNNTKKKDTAEDFIFVIVWLQLIQNKLNRATKCLWKTCLWNVYHKPDCGFEQSYNFTKTGHHNSVGSKRCLVQLNVKARLLVFLKTTHLSVGLLYSTKEAEYQHGNYRGFVGSRRSLERAEERLSLPGSCGLEHNIFLYCVEKEAV